MSPASVSTSTVNKSQAARPPQVRLQECLPRRAVAPFGCRVDPVAAQDPLHGVPGDLVLREIPHLTSS